MYYLFISRTFKCPGEAIVNLSEYGNEPDWQFGNLPDAIRAFNRTVNYVTVHDREVFVQLVTYTLCNCVKIIEENIMTKKILLNDVTNINCSIVGNTPVVSYSNPSVIDLQLWENPVTIPLTISSPIDCANIAITENPLYGNISITGNNIVYTMIALTPGVETVTDTFKFSVMNMVTGCFVENEIEITWGILAG